MQNIILISLFIFLVLSYHRASRSIWSGSLALLLLFPTFHYGLTLSIGIAWCILIIFISILHFRALRFHIITKPLLQFYRSVMPSMSRTEREAIAAGTVTWEGELFKGNPDWQKLLSIPPAQLSTEEKAFLEGPVETLCSMLHDWNITHDRADLPPAIWQYLKEQGFFGLIIPKQYGGKAFSAYAHSQILLKVSGRSITASSTIAVPNSLGPAELLLHYGTEDQKNYYLPRLARGEEIPCFALTSPEAGSDASAMTDHGIVCYELFEGQKTLGIRIQFNKRYITLAPIATVIGLAFKLYDPQHLLGTKEEVGITCALIPRNTPGIIIGRRHFPINTPFQNGPIQGDIFIPLTWIIGGKKQAGKGWRMLMESLAAGRAISLPANALGGAKIMAYATGAYARIRRQFNQPIGRFEGIEEPLARIGAYTYIMDAARTLAAAAIDRGEKPSVVSAIVKYHVTELGRKVGCDSMDIHAGKGICLGPKNYIGRGYEAAPIAITVEGANILTRSMIIFGQGAMRCHPYVFAELEAAKLTDDIAALKAFDQAVMKHIAFAISNLVRSFVLGITGAYFISTPKGPFKRYFQQATRFSSAFAFMTDVAMLIFGNQLKRKESLSGRLGDILSYLYLLSAVLKQYQDQGEHKEDLPIVRYAALYCLFEIQERFAEIIKNLPNRFLAQLLKIFIFPTGQRFCRPNDLLGHKISQLLMAPTASRERLSAGIYTAPEGENNMALLQDALIKTIAAEPIAKQIRIAKQEGKITGYTRPELAQAALTQQIINQEAFDIYMQAHTARYKVIAVDDFAPEELSRTLHESISSTIVPADLLWQKQFNAPQ